MLQDRIVTLINNFSPDNLISFLAEKDNNFQFLETKYRDYNIFKEIKLLAQKKLEDSNKFGVWTIKTEGALSERSGKKRQFELAKNILRSEDFDAGLFAFYDENGNFRLSLVYAVYKGKKVELSSYKRYTYFVEKGKRYRTFEKALNTLSFESLEKIKESFSRKPLIREFYREIQNWYAWALKDPQVFFPSGRKEEHLIRLITRLVFVWFLKEKNLVPSLIFEPESLKHIVKDFMKGTNYYNVILQNLFFATLNTPAKGRRFANNEDFLKNRQDFGVKNLYRYKELLEISEEEFIRLFERVPFINGGLFECLDEDKNYVDGFTRNEKYRARIPDYLFFSEEITQDLSDFYGERRRERVKGLINILKDYNFTTDESTPLDVEVSLDPELLGHIFENLLASYNPETQETARKLTGSYYTPIEIVDFMVESALLEYFKRKTNIDEKRLEELFSSERMPELTEEERRQIVESIDSIKVLDPAVGSGAFPMAVLHKLVRLLEKVDPDNRLWKEKQKEKVLKSAEEIFERESKEVREELLKELNENFDQALREPDYARKLYIIQNSIYGVDIQPIAIQITKLRFFLTLLIDQKIGPSKENLGIKPLPHLETNFVSANTLIKLQRPQYSLMPREFNDLRKELLELYKRHFSVRTRQEKKRIQEKAKEIREKIKEMLQRSGWSSELARKIADFDIFDQLSEADWFDPEWMCGVEGFDIVIGNPPYGDIAGDYRDIITTQYRYFEKRKNLASFFIELPIYVSKPSGIVFYIVPKSLSHVESWERTRNFLLQETQLLMVIDVSEAFKNVRLEQIIIGYIMKKEKNYKFTVGDYWGEKININGKVDVNVCRSLSTIAIYIGDKMLDVYQKIRENSIKLGDITEIFRGLGWQKYISKEGDIEVLKGDNIKKFYIEHPLQKIKIPQGALSVNKTKKIMRPKIVAQNIVAHVLNPYDRIVIMASYDPEGLLTLDTVMNVILKTNKFTYEYILGILNSRFAEWFYYWFVYNRAVRTMHFDAYYMGKLPIKEINSENQAIAEQIEELVSQILQIKAQDPNADTQELERQIDQLVYQLYKLTPEEIELIERKLSYSQ